MKCSATTKADKPCPNHALTGESVCIAHAPGASERAKVANAASAVARKDAHERRKEAAEEALLTLTMRIRREAAEHAQAIAEALVEAAIADGSSRAMAELLNRVEGKVVDSIVINETDPFQMSEAQLHKWLSDNSPEYGPAEDEDH